MEKKSILEVYKEICKRYFSIQKGHYIGRSDLEMELAWVMSLLEQTEEVNPTK